MSFESRISELGIELPAVAEPRGAYVPAIVTGKLCTTAAQLPFRGGEVTFQGRVGSEVSLEAAQEAAKLATLNALAAIRRELGSLDEVSKVVRVGGYVTAATGFSDVHLVTNGASDLLERVFADRGRHVRASVGVASLPLNAAVAVELTVEVR